MKKTKMEKGITLIALIITIVVLLILAAVAIAAIQNENILSHANNATVKYNESVGNEQTTLGDYLNFLNNQGGSGNGEGSGSQGGSGSEGGSGNQGGSGATIGDATVGTKTTSLSTINGEEYSANNPVIPAGFIPINTATSSWDGADLAAEVKKGLVITDSVDSNGVSNGNEFVWIPVSEINSFARLQDGSDTNYRGVLYDWEIDATGATEFEWTTTGTSFREPANLTESSEGWDDNPSKFSTITWNENLYQESFNAMVESVAKYKGFYVGRYEMSINTSSGKAQSKAGEYPMSHEYEEYTSWWALYEKALTYSQTGVISEMIWGCQYDAIMKWMKGNNIDVTSETPTDTSRGEIASANEWQEKTGSADSNDILNNIYDIIGNMHEFTQEACETYKRLSRGLDYNGEGGYWGSPSVRRYDDLSNMVEGQSVDTRLTLYVEL